MLAPVPATKAFPVLLSPEVAVRTGWIPAHIMPYPADVMSPSSRPIGRAWTMFFAGWVLVASSFFIVAAQEYQFIASPPTFQNFHQIELYPAVEAILDALGVALVGLGWVLSWRTVPRTVGIPGGSMRIPGSTLSYVTVIFGISCIAGFSIYGAYVDIEQYDQVPLNLWKWSGVALEFVLGLGILLVAIGWLIHHFDLRAAGLDR